MRVPLQSPQKSVYTRVLMFSVLAYSCPANLYLRFSILAILAPPKKEKRADKLITALYKALVIKVFVSEVR